MNRELIDRWCERGILGLVLAILVYGPLATGAVRTIDFLVLQALTTGALALWLIRLWLGETHRILWTPVSWAVVLFSGYAIYRYYHADIEYVARLEVLRALLYACIFFLIVNHLHRQDSLQIIAYVLFALATFVSIYALYQFATNSPYVWDFIKPVQYMKRATGTYICPNHLAGFLEMILPLAIAYLFMGKVSHLARILIGYAVLMMLAGIGVSVSRGGCFATGIALLVFFALLIRNRNYRLPALLFLGLILITTLVFVSNTEHSHERFEQVFASGNEDIRFRLWKPAIEMWEESPWLGVGPAHFDYRFRQYRPLDIQLRPERVHNDYLNTLVDWGIVGFVLVLAAWVLLYMGAIKTWKFVRYNADGLKSRPTNKAAWVLGGSIGIFAILLHSFVDFNFHIPANAILAVTLLAVISSLLRFATDRYWVSSGILVRLLLTAFCVASIGLFGTQGMRRWKENQLIEQARLLPEYSLKRAAVLEKAWSVEPNNFETTYEVGEIYRLQCFAGETNSLSMGEIALRLFERTRISNPYDAYNYMRYGMALDFLKRFDAGSAMMKRANELDPNGYYVRAHEGWHYIQLASNEERNGHYAQARELYLNAKEWFDRSLQLKYNENIIALRYRDIAMRKMRELAEMK